MPIRNHNIQDWIKSLNVKTPPKKKFWDLGDKTALRYKDGRFYRSNFERGMLLYSLIAHYRPRVVMEFGTGRGYGTLSMAWAMADHQIDGKIYTVDVISPDEKINWAINWDDGKSPQNDSLSWNAVWRQFAPKSWLNRIEFLTGDSSQTIRDYSGDQIDFAFIDGAHDGDGVRHDYYALLNHVNPSFGILFDDYENRPTFGVCELINEEVKPHFDVHLLQTQHQVLATGESYPTKSKMAWIHSDSLDKPLKQVYDFTKMNRFIKSYHRDKFPTSLQTATYHIRRFAQRTNLWLHKRLPF